MYRFIVSSLLLASFVYSQGQNMGIQSFGGVSASTLPPPFGFPGGPMGSTFRPPMGMGGGLGQPSFPNNMNNGFPNNANNGFPNSMNNGFPINSNNGFPNNVNNGMMPFNSNQGSGPLSGFTNGFAPNMPMNPPTGGMFPLGNPFGGQSPTPGSFNPIGGATPAPIIVKKRQVGIPQPGTMNGQISGSGAAQPFGVASAPGFSNAGLSAQGTFQNSALPGAFPDNSQGAFGVQAGLGASNPLQPVQPPTIG